MAATAFDTLQAARDMEAAGLERAQAEAIAEAIHQRSADYATKADVDTLKAEIIAEIARAKYAVLVALLAAVGVILAGVAFLR
ncbi:MAG: DUF1640 domain-containing protein [Gammaproteobacteria bacterium]|nr:DUF1640 domain-containing protein [Gammaproteobacteria bacterium]